MGLNVSTSMGFENKDFLRDTAKNILKNGGATNEVTSKIVDELIFENKRNFTDLYPNSQLAIIKAATQISVNGSLNQTLKYLKDHANRKTVKTPIFGEIWESFSENYQESDEDSYNGELINFKIDSNVKNIFAA